MKEEDVRIRSFTVQSYELSRALEKVRMSSSMDWKSSPVEVHKVENQFLVIVRVSGYYPYMDSKLDDVMSEFDPSITRR